MLIGQNHKQEKVVGYFNCTHLHAPEGKLFFVALKYIFLFLFLIINTSDIACLQSQVNVTVLVFYGYMIYCVCVYIQTMIKSILYSLIRQGKFKTRAKIFIS